MKTISLSDYEVILYGKYIIQKVISSPTSIEVYVDEYESELVSEFIFTQVLKNSSYASKELAKRIPYTIFNRDFFKTNDGTPVNQISKEIAPSIYLSFMRSSPTEIYFCSCNDLIEFHMEYLFRLIDERSKKYCLSCSCELPSIEETECWACRNGI